MLRRPSLPQTPPPKLEALLRAIHAAPRPLALLPPSKARSQSSSGTRSRLIVQGGNVDRNRSPQRRRNDDVVAELEGDLRTYPTRDFVEMITRAGLSRANVFERLLVDCLSTLGDFSAPRASRSRKKAGCSRNKAVASKVAGALTLRYRDQQRRRRLRRLWRQEPRG